RLSRLSGASVRIGNLQVLLARFNKKTLLRIQVSQLHRSFDIDRIQLRYFLEHRDGLERKAALAIAVGDSGEVGNRVLNLSRAYVQIAKRVDRCQVSRVGVNDLSILINRRRDF